MDLVVGNVWERCRLVSEPGGFRSGGRRDRSNWQSADTPYTSN